MIYNLYKGDGEIVSLECELVDFLLKLPNFISKKTKLIPPNIVIKQILKEGNYNAGMSGIITWKKTDFNMVELSQLNKLLVERGFEKTNTPNWVVDRSTWLVWTYEYLHNVPSSQHLKLNNQIIEINAKLKACNEKEIKEALTLELFKLEMNLTEFISEYI